MTSYDDEAAIDAAIREVRMMIEVRERALACDRVILAALLAQLQSLPATTTAEPF